MSTTLATYTLQTRRLLHDATGQYYGTPTDPNELTDYINEARLQVTADTGCNRILQVGAISTGVESYNYGGVTGVNVVSSNNLFASVPTITFTNAAGDATGSGASATAICSGTAPNLTVTSVNMVSLGTGYTLPPVVTFSGAGTAVATAGILQANTLDVLNVTIQWGSGRVPLNYMAWTQFNRDLRGLMQYVQRPVTFSTYGQSAVYLGPVPDQTYIAEFDTVIIPYTLVNQTDIDTLIPPYTMPVPWYAAYLAKQKEGEMGESDRFLAGYKQRARAAVAAVFTRRIANQYTAM